MPFFQSTRNALADPALMKATVADLGAMATSVILDGAEHSFHMPARSGHSEAKCWTRCLRQSHRPFMLTIRRRPPPGSNLGFL